MMCDWQNKSPQIFLRALIIQQIIIGYQFSFSIFFAFPSKIRYRM